MEAGLNRGISHVLRNKPAAGYAGIAPRLAVGHHWRGAPEPGRSAAEVFRACAKRPIQFAAVFVPYAKKHAHHYIRLSQTIDASSRQTLKREWKDGFSGLSDGEFV